MAQELVRTDHGVPAVPAASVLLLRSGEKGMEVFMLERHLDSDFVGGAFVFPGGKVDPIDTDTPADLVRGTTDDMGFRVAAIRETFEESGVLLAQRRDAPLPAHQSSTEDFRAARHRLSSRGSSWDWRPWLRGAGLRLDIEALAWWSWWVTPVGVHRRFDTRFYAASVPEGHHAEHDDVETTDSRWIRPADALAAAVAGDMSIILPTRKNLESLVEYASPQHVLDAARHGSPPPRIQPDIMADDSGRLLVTHPSFSEPERP